MAAVNIDIPDVFRPTLERIASLSSEELEQVRLALASLKVHVKPEMNLEQAKATKTSVSEFPEIFQALASLNITRFRVDAPLDEFVHAVAFSIRLKKDQPDIRPVLEERLRFLLSLEPLVLSAKVFDVQHEYEKIFRKARIMTDIRPVFDPSGAEAIGAMVVHSLSVAYVQSGEHKEIVFAMDDADISALRKLLDRAENKSKTTEKLIEKSGIKYFESK